MGKNKTQKEVFVDIYYLANGNYLLLCLDEKIQRIMTEVEFEEWRDNLCRLHEEGKAVMKSIELF